MSTARKLVPKGPNAPPSWDPIRDLGSLSPHRFTLGDILVRRADAVRGRVVQATEHYAIVEWETGDVAEIEQHDRAIDVRHRGSECYGRSLITSHATQMEIDSINQRLL